MQEKHNTSQFGTKLGVWLHHGLKALQFTIKSGRMTKKVAAPLGLSLMLTKFKHSPAKADEPASVRCAPIFSPIGRITGIPETIAPFPAGKLGEVVRLMGREGGVNVDDLIVLTGWQRHTVRAALCRLRKRGFVITVNQHNGWTTYTLQQSQGQ
ncbi:MAG: DUF3489 domain-containing protein [Sphingomonadales bacterium]|nr:DUF3489 domain-containing protein [Sphingomonadales bacterium]